MSTQELEQWLFFTTKLGEILQEEEEYWKLRSKQNWLEEGDTNTKFFHTIATHRAKKNRINSLEINGVLTNNIVDIKAHVVEYYKDLLGSTGHLFGSLGPNFWNIDEQLTTLEKWDLERSFTEEELKHAVFASEPNGAPGPDGFTFKFYQFFWDIVKSDLMLLSHYFYEN